MKRLLLFASLFFSLTAVAQIPLPYYTGFDDNGGQDGWTEYRLGEENQFYEWEYATNMPYSAPTVLVHNYPVGGQNLLDDWFVSPPFNIAGGGQLDSVRYAFSGFGVPGAGDTVAIYLLSGSPDPEIAERTLLHDFRDADYVGDGAWRRLDPIALPAQSGNIHFAFRYSTVVNWLDVRFDNFTVSGSSIGLEEHTANRATLFPNPSNGEIGICFDEGTEESLLLSLFDATGKCVLTQTVAPGESVRPELAAGMYQYRIVGEQTNSSGKLVIR